MNQYKTDRPTTYWRYVLMMVLGIYSVAVPALQIAITQGNVAAFPIAIVPFGNETGMQKLPLSVAQVITADLKRSGLFNPLPLAELPARPSRAAQIQWPMWRAAEAEHLLIGRIRVHATTGYQLDFHLFDVTRGQQMLAYRVIAEADGLRTAAHQIADRVYRALTGKPGAFNTRIAYVTSTRTAAGQERNQLKVADADGYNAQTIVTSREPLMSPAWSPDGQQLAYVAFQRGRSMIWVQNIATSERRKIAAYPGINGAPAWSPDGKKIALTLSKGGNPDIHILTLATGELRSLTHHPGIDTEPAWSPDGQHIVFTSNRGGSPQLYRIPVNDGQARRLTFEGDYNARAAYAPDGRHIALVTRVAGRYRIGLLDMRRGELRLLSKGALDESPVFAPNGSLVLYASREGERDVLATVSVDSSFQQRISLEAAAVREPAWSPH
ncbi:MAG: Tol-Pal system beta propeller repeat protein TolB [Pseudomonadota bacterium]